MPEDQKDVTPSPEKLSLSQETMALEERFKKQSRESAKPKPKQERRRDDPAAAEAKIKELGIEEEDILSAGTTAAGPSQRYWQCPLCKRYMDALLVIDGRKRIVFPDRLKCAACGSPDLDTVEGEFLNTKRHGEVLKAKYVPPIEADMIDFIREGAALMDDAGLFNADVKDDEPTWPRSLAAAIVGSAMYLGRGGVPLEKKKVYPSGGLVVWVGALVLCAFAALGFMAVRVIAFLVSQM